MLILAVESRTPFDLLPRLPRRPRNSPRSFTSVVAAYPAAQTIHLVVDNLNIHCEKSLRDHFGRQRGRAIWGRLTVHFTRSMAVGSIKRKSN